MDTHRIISAIRYVIKARGNKRIHSPFLFECSDHLLDKHRYYHDFDVLEDIRLDLEENNRVLTIEDFGAGSKKSHTSKRQVSAIAGTSVKRGKYAELMYRLANWRQPKAVLELGTSLGLTTLYLAKACPKAKVVTLEGSTELCGFAQELFKEHGAKNITIVQGEFQHTLPEVVDQQDWDLAFIDGNHRHGATIDAVHSILPHASDQAVFVIDDIYWSRGMTKAWDELKARKEFTLSIDLFEMGILFRNQPMQKQHFVLRY